MVGWLSIRTGVKFEYPGGGLKRQESGEWHAYGFRQCTFRGVCDIPHVCGWQISSNVVYRGGMYLPSWIVFLVVKPAPLK